MWSRGNLSDRHRSADIRMVEGIDQYRNWPPVYREWQTLIAAETEESLARKIAYRDLKGNPWETPLWQIVMHMVNHGTHHRGQVAGFLRTMGHTPPPLDLIAYYRTLP